MQSQYSVKQQSNRYTKIYKRCNHMWYSYKVWNKEKLEKQNANILMMSDILNKSINGSGYNENMDYLEVIEQQKKELNYFQGQETS